MEMELAELVRAEEADRRLRAWDWLADLRADERTLTWLARHTERPVRSIYDYAYRKTPPPVAWLRKAWRVIHLGERKEAK